MDAAGSAGANGASVDARQIDPWEAEDEVEQSPNTRSAELRREWEARRLQFHNLGYRDGISEGKSSSVQEGFNAGFKEAGAPAFSWGVARGASSAYAALPVALREALVRDEEDRRGLEALQGTISGISSAQAMGMYYDDSVLRKGERAGGDDGQRTGLSGLSLDEAVGGDPRSLQSSRGEAGVAASPSGMDGPQVSSAGNSRVAQSDADPAAASSDTPSRLEQHARSVEALLQRAAKPVKLSKFHSEKQSSS